MAAPFTAKMIAPCGLDCSICSKALDEVNPCLGCNGPDEFKYEYCTNRCGITRCETRNTRGYTFCDECPEYPCEDVMEKESRYGSKYPLKESPLSNIRTIRELGMQSFLEQQQARWTCPACGGIISVHTGACSSCGKAATSPNPQDR